MLRSTRFVLLAAAVAYPLFWLSRQTQGVHDPLWMRAAIVAAALLLLALTYGHGRLRRRLHDYMLGLILLITGHLFYLLTVNGLRMTYLVGFLVMLTVVSGGFPLGIRRRSTLRLFLLSVVGGGVASAALVQAPQTPVSFYLLVILVSALLAYAGIRTQLVTWERLEASERRLGALVKGAPVILWTTDRQGNLTFLDGKGLVQLDRSPSELLGRGLHELFGDDPDIGESLDAASRGMVTRFTVEVDDFVFEMLVAPACEVDGSVQGAVGVASDITELRLAEQNLRQSQKMEAIGRLAGGMAHDFNNILTAILGYCGQLRDDPDTARDSRRAIAEIEEAAKRAAALTRQLLAFSRRQKLHPRRIDLNNAVPKMISMLERLIGEDVRLVTRLDSELGAIEADPTGVEQVILNLAVNARDAMPDGGTLEIETENVYADWGDINANPPLPAGAYIALVVSDTGEGMDPGTRERMFEPFFTTKEEGTGLGLSTVYGIVEQTRGGIAVSSEPGEGTTFRVFFPRATGGARATNGDERPESSPPSQPHRPRTILVVEDDTAVRRLARTVLEEHGYRTMGAPNGRLALRQLEAVDRPPDLLLTDVVMPELNGRLLASHAGVRYPSMPILFMSGFHDELNPDDRERLTPMLSKPFSPDDLVSRIEETLRE